MGRWFFSSTVGKEIGEVHVRQSVPTDIPPRTRVDDSQNPLLDPRLQLLGSGQRVIGPEQTTHFGVPKVAMVSDVIDHLLPDGRTILIHEHGDDRVAVNTRSRVSVASVASCEGW